MFFLSFQGLSTFRFSILICFNIPLRFRHVCLHSRPPRNNPMDARAPSLGPRQGSPQWATNYRPQHIFKTFFSKERTHVRKTESPLQKSGRLYRLTTSVCHIISFKRMEALPSNQSNLMLTLLISSITDIILDFISSLCCCGLSEHDAVQQESSCYFGHCTQF